ncbi:MAG: hypothetical protein ABIH08_03220 [Candidatus Omnitrophota bacterium]
MKNTLAVFENFKIRRIYDEKKKYKNNRVSAPSKADKNRPINGTAKD